MNNFSGGLLVDLKLTIKLKRTVVLINMSSGNGRSKHILFFESVSRFKFCHGVSIFLGKYWTGCVFAVYLTRFTLKLLLQLSLG